MVRLSPLILASRRFACAAMAALASLPLASPAYAADCPNTDLAPSPANLDQVRAALVCLHNADRAARGAILLRQSRRLRAAAQQHSSQMVQQRYFDHTSPSGETFVDRVIRTGYVGWSDGWALGENLAWGTGDRGTARGVEDAWMTSSGHRANILNRAYREVGVGIGLGSPINGAAGVTFTVEFGARW